MKVRRLLAGACVGALALIAVMTPSAVAMGGIDGREEPLPGAIITVAGTGDSYGEEKDTTRRATDLTINFPVSFDVAADGIGYVAEVDERDDRWMVHAVEADGGTRVVYSTRFVEDESWDIAAGTNGALYALTGQGVRRIGRDGSSSLIARAGAGGLGELTDIAADDQGGVYVVSAEEVFGSNCTFPQCASEIIRIDRTGATTTIGGGGQRAPLQSDGKPATSARFGPRVQIAADSRGVVYVADGNLHGVDDPPAPSPLKAVHKIDVDGTLRTVLPGRQQGHTGDGGPASSATAGADIGELAIDSHENLYLADVDNGVIRVVDTEGLISTVPTPLPDRFVADIALGPDDELYVAVHDRVVELTHGRSRPPAKRTPSYLRRYAGVEDGGVRAVPVDGPQVDVAITPDGKLLTVGGPDGTTLRSVDRNGTVSGVLTGQLAGASVRAVAAGVDGTLFVAATRNRVEAVYSVAPDGRTDVIAGGGRLEARVEAEAATSVKLVGITDLAVSPNGRLYVAHDGGVHRLTGDGLLDYRCCGSDFTAIAVDAAERVYGTSRDTDLVERIGSGGSETTIAGRSAERFQDDENKDKDSGFDPGDDATTARLNDPAGVAVDEAGNTFISSDDGVHRVDAAGRITTVVAADGKAGGALALDRHGDLYVAGDSVEAVARPAGLAIPFDWTPVVWWGALGVAVGACGLLAWRRFVTAGGDDA